MRILQKSFFVQMFSMMTILLAYSCSNDDNAPEGTLTVSKKQMAVLASNLEGAPVEINASGNWTAKVSDRWILLSQSIGDAGTTTLKMYVDNSAIDEAENGYKGKVTLSLVDNPEVMAEIAITREEENGYGYRTLYSLNVQHDYFEGTSPTALSCRLSVQGTEVAKRLNLLFRQTAINEWSVLFDGNKPKFGTEGDVLSLELGLTDPSFVFYTDWPDFRTSAAYELELSGTETELDATNAIRPSGNSKSIGSNFCSVSLHLTDEMIEKALDNKAVETSLHFPARSVKWEYFFISRTQPNEWESGLMLEDVSKRIVFGELKPTIVYGRKCLVTTSEEKIPMRSKYDYRLRLMQQQEGNKKRTLLINIEPPVPGRFVADDKNVIRQICYY